MAGGPRPPAPWGRRVAAFLVDVVVAGFGALIVALAVTRPSAETAAGGGYTLRWHGGGLFALIALVYLGFVAYFAFLGGSRKGQTLGAMAVGIAVRDGAGGGQIGAARGLVRALVLAAFVIPSAFVFVPWLIDVLWPLRDPRRQALHDKAARSVVVDLRRAVPRTAA